MADLKLVSGRMGKDIYGMEVSNLQCCKYIIIAVYLRVNGNIDAFWKLNALRKNAWMEGGGEAIIT